MLPAKGTPEYAVWMAAIAVAINPPVKPGRNVSSAQVYWRRIEALRAALEAAGIDWRDMKRRSEN